MKILLIVYDNESYTNTFPIGTAYIAAILMKNGYDVEIYDQAINHFPEEHLTKYLDEHEFDVVGMGVIGGYYQYRKLLKISDAVNRSKKRPFYVIGGHGPSPEPEFFMTKTGADVITIGEAEATVLELFDRIQNRRSLTDVRGIAFLDNGKVVVNPRRDVIPNIDELPFPAYNLFDISHYRLIREPRCINTDFVLSMISGRGCPYNCNFCYRMDKGFRPRSNEGIIEEIQMLKTVYGITYVSFYDELLMSSEKRIVGLCEDFIRKEINVKWSCSGRLNFAKKDTLSLMRRAGCVFINYGIEAFDDRILQIMNKHLTTFEIEQGIKATIDAGISPGLNIIWGNIGEDKDTLQKGVDFLLKYDDGAQLRTIRPVTPYPGSPLYYHAIEKGMLKDCEDFYENKHVNSDLVSVNFTDMDDDHFHQCLCKANETLIKNYFRNKLSSIINDSHLLYHEKNVKFRGFRQN